MLAGPDLLVVLVIASIVLGPKKLPELAKTLGKALYFASFGGKHPAKTGEDLEKAGPGEKFPPISACQEDIS